MEEKSGVLRLAKPKLRGLPGLLFSRLPFIVLMIVLQLLLMAGVYLRLSEYIPHFLALQSLFTLAMVFYLYSNSMDAAAKLTWILLIVLFPVPGALLLAYVQTNLGHRVVKARIAQLIGDTRGALAQDAAVLDALARKAKAGVDVRVMYDGMCEITTLPHNYPKRLAKLGIRAKMFAPIALFVCTGADPKAAPGNGAAAAPAAS